jgi:uncharacterized protein YbcC (UPF0753/DUF2309 family)
MGWKNLPISSFIGHGEPLCKQSFWLSLDCGACAAGPGRHNAGC